MILPGWPLVLLLQQPMAPPVVSTQVKAQASVILVRGKIEGIHGHQGSGVVIAPHLVATNAHVVEGACELTVSQGPTTWPVTTVRLDVSRDICLLTVPTLPLAPAEVASELPEPGQAVFAVGYPGGHGPVVSKGTLRGIWHHREGRLLQSDALILPGSSGGGLFNAEGQLLGLTTLTFTSSPRLNFSVPATWVQSLTLQAVGEEASPSGWGLENHSTDLMERLSADSRNWPAWEAAARQWVQDLPDDEDAWLALSLALDCSARASIESHPEAFFKLQAEAVEAYRRSLSLRRDAKTLNNLGVALDLLNRFDEAERAFTEALALQPTYAKAWLNLGSAQFNAGRFASASETFAKGLTFQPDASNAWICLAHCQWMIGQRETAVATLQIGLRYRPLAAELWLDLGLWLVELAHLGEAREVHARLVDLNPEVAARLQASLNRAKRTGARARGDRPRP